MINTLLKNRLKSTLIPKRIPITNEQLNRLPESESICFRTEDGLLLKGNWFQNSSNKIIILSHSFGANRFGWNEEGNKDTIDWIPSILQLIDANFNVLVFDHRACGESEGFLSYFGVKEALDIKAAFQWIIENKSCEQKPLNDFSLIGFSSGANATLLALKDLEKEQNIYFSAILVNLYWYAKMFPNSLNYFLNLPKKLASLFNNPTSELVGFNPNLKINPSKDVSTIKSPLLFVNSKTDEIANTEDIKAIYTAANCRKELLLLDGHRFDSYHVITKEKRKIMDFLSSRFKDAPLLHKKIAVLTIEYQNSWTEKGFFHNLIKQEYRDRNIYSNTLSLLENARNLQVPVIHAPLSLDKNDKVRYKKAPFPARLFKQLTKNTWKSQITSGIYQVTDCMIEERSSYNACIDSNLVQTLKKHKIDLVILCGFTTDHCVKETFDALIEEQFSCLIADDCTATLSPKKQNDIRAHYPLLTNNEIFQLFSNIIQ